MHCDLLVTTGFESFFLRPNRFFRSNLLYVFCFKTFLLHVLIKSYPDIHFKGWIKESPHIIKRFIVCFSHFMLFGNGLRSNLLYALASSVHDYYMFKSKQIRFTTCLAVQNIIIIKLVCLTFILFKFNSLYCSLICVSRFLDQIYFMLERCQIKFTLCFCDSEHDNSMCGAIQVKFAPCFVTQCTITLCFEPARSNLLYV